MGKLYFKRCEVERIIKERNLDEFDIKGRISLKTGFILTFIKEETPDDENKIKILDEAIHETLG